MSDIRRHIDLIESVESGKPSAIDAEKLADLLARWIETDPIYTERYSASRKALASRILRFEHIAHQFRHVSEPVLYRGYNLRGKERRMLFGNGSLTITPRSSDLLESWTADPSWAYEHAAQFEDGIVITKQSSQLDIFMDITAFAAMVTGLDAVEGEMLVRPKLLIVTPSEVEQVSDEE